LPGANDNCALRWAAYEGHLDVVVYLCELPAERGVDPATNNQWVVRRAAARNRRFAVLKFVCGLPTVDPSVVMKSPSQLHAYARHIAWKALARRGRWTMARAAWVGAVAAAAAAAWPSP
jgi:hypothetical protein